MKTGKTIVELAKELERQLGTKKDYVAPTQKLCYKVETLEVANDTSHKTRNIPISKLQMVNGEVKTFGVKDLAEEQIASRLQIPKKYFDRMKVTAPRLLETNVNHWLMNEPDRFMVRTLDNNVRAILSNRYRPLDNYDLAETVLPILSEKDVQIVSSEVTDNRMYIKAVTPKVSAEIVKGDIVQAGIVISNSEVGLGAVKVEPMIYRLVCTNGLISADSSMRKYHVGRGNDADEMLREYFTNETRRTDDKAFWLKVRDIVRGALAQDIFGKLVEKMRNSTRIVIDAKPGDVVEVISERYQLAEPEKESILTHLIRGNSLTQWGLVNAVTRSAEDSPSYDRATELERLGGEILELHGKPWEQIATAVHN